MHERRPLAFEAPACCDRKAHQMANSFINATSHSTSDAEMWGAARDNVEPFTLTPPAKSRQTPVGYAEHNRATDNFRTSVPPVLREPLAQRTENLLAATPIQWDAVRNSVLAQLRYVGAQERFTNLGRLEQFNATYEKLKALNDASGKVELKKITDESLQTAIYYRLLNAASADRSQSSEEALKSGLDEATTLRKFGPQDPAFKQYLRGAVFQFSLTMRGQDKL
jgi:hypothetical protein